ncbi:MAG: hypothetical protein AABX07_00830 [Nanoarchaeota archaeon]
MAVDIKNLIAAINPGIYCEKFKIENGITANLREQVKSIAQEQGYLKAAEKAKLIESDYMEFDDASDKAMYYKNPFNLTALKAPVEKHSLIYDSFGESLEPIYFWLLDTINKEYADIKKIEKVIDNFISSPGSAHFSEMGGKATKMQEEAMKLLGAANQVIKSVINIIYDLKEMKLRLDLYKNFKSDKPEIKGSAQLSLKQLWMDSVDIKRGNSSIKVMAQQFQFVTLIDAFMAADSLKSIEKIDLNDRVKRILLQRVGEFEDWLKASEKELAKRFEIEKIYLKSQVNSVKIYARWVKPYLKAAKALEQRATPTAALVNSFNTSLFELAFLAIGEYDPIKDDIPKGDLPKMVSTAKRRNYNTLMLVELTFRTAPERAQQGGYGFRGRVEVSFTSAALNTDEIEVLKKEIEKDDLGDLFKTIEGVTDDSMEQLKVDIDELLKDEDEEKEKKKEEDTNPFSALASLFKKETLPAKKSESKESKSPAKIEPDNDIEKVMRNQAVVKARQECRKIYDLYKKAHSLPGF